ncbi:hypothetical protein AHiyo6_35370, partial [Arthrobacter sp. Hiyo6]
MAPDLRPARPIKATVEVLGDRRSSSPETSAASGTTTQTTTATEKLAQNTPQAHGSWLLRHLSADYWCPHETDVGWRDLAGLVNEGGPPDPKGHDMNEIDALMDAERTRMLGVLEELDDEQWNAPSLCAGWRVRDVVVHLLMPYHLTVPRFLGNMAAAGFKFDAMADRWARKNNRPTRHITEALRQTAKARFRIPGARPRRHYVTWSSMPRTSIGHSAWITLLTRGVPTSSWTSWPLRRPAGHSSQACSTGSLSLPMTPAGTTHRRRS